MTRRHRAPIVRGGGIEEANAHGRKKNVKFRLPYDAKMVRDADVESVINKYESLSREEKDMINDQLGGTDSKVIELIREENTPNHVYTYYTLGGSVFDTDKTMTNAYVVQQMMKKNDAPTSYQPVAEMVTGQHGARMKDVTPETSSGILGVGAYGTIVKTGKYAVKFPHRQEKDWINNMNVANRLSPTTRVNHTLLPDTEEQERLSRNLPHTAGITYFCDGDTLLNILAKNIKTRLYRGIAFDDLFYIVATGVGKVLAELHAAGRVHGDLHLDNIMVCVTGGKITARVIDFGLTEMRSTPDAYREELMKLVKILRILLQPANGPELEILGNVRSAVVLVEATHERAERVSTAFERTDEENPTRQRPLAARKPRTSTAPRTLAMPYRQGTQMASHPSVQGAQTTSVGGGRKKPLARASKRPAKPPRNNGRWLRTDDKVRTVDGARTLYRNSKTGALRVRKAVCDAKTGRREYKYVAATVK
jgi:tRNA A-37 threonylcarbamoyl transferase component Bud32